MILCGPFVARRTRFGTGRFGLLIGVVAWFVVDVVFFQTVHFFWVAVSFACVEGGVAAVFGIYQRNALGRLVVGVGYVLVVVRLVREVRQIRYRGVLVDLLGRRLIGGGLS